MTNPDNLEVELLITDDRAEVVLARNKQRFADFVRDIEKKQPQLKFTVSTNQGFIDLDKLEKKAEETRKRFSEIASVRLSAGNINNLTREMVAAHERSRQLVGDIAAIKSELSNPKRKSSIAFLTEELRAAEKEAESLNRKLSSLPSPSGGKSGGSRRRGLTEGQRAFLEVTDDFVPRGFNRPYNAIGKPLLESGDPLGQISKFTGLSVAGLAAITGIAVAGLAIVKYSISAREEAEKRLATEKQITAEFNKQNTEINDLIKAGKTAREKAEFNGYLSSASIEQLKERRTTLEKLRQIEEKYRAPTPELNDAISKNEAQIVEKQQQKTKQLNDAMDQRWEDYKKSLENTRKAEENAIERRNREIEKFNQSVEQGKNKVGELANKWNSAFESIFSRQQTENPFVRIFTDADKSLNNLRENIKGLRPDLQSAALAMEAKINARQLIEARLDNRLGAFDLRNDAKNFRNPYDAEKDKQTQERYIQDFLRKNPNFLYLKKQEYDAEERVSGYKNSQSFEDYYRKDILQRGKSLFDTPENRLNKSLEERFRVLYNGRLTGEQTASADRRFISATAGINPLSLNDNLREKAALARERDADRRENYEKDALQTQKELIAVNRRLADNQDALIKIAQKEGIKGIKNYLEIIDKTNGSVKVLGASPKPEDMNGYDLGFAGGTNY